MSVAARTLIALAVLATAETSAGDLRLVIQQESPPCPGQYATARATPEEAAADLIRAFDGEEPRIRALRAIVMNGAIGYCTRADRMDFERRLADIGTRPSLLHERKYTDLVLMLATAHLVEQLAARRDTPGLSPRARRRLEFATAAAARRLVRR